MSTTRSDLGVLLAGVALLALASPLVKWLITQGGRLAEPGAISFCNVLFVGNLCASLVTLIYFGPRKTTRTLIRELPRAPWFTLLNIAFAIAIPTLIFTALQTTSAVNVAFLGRFESVAYAIVAAILGTQIRRGQWAGYATIGIGVVLLASFESQWMPMRGDLLIVLAALLQGVAAHTTRPVLERTGLGAFVVVRNFASAVVFFGIATYLYGFEHFMDAFGPKLWVVMTIYATFAVAGGQLAWYRSLERVPSGTIASVAMLSPAFGVLFVWLLLGTPPTNAQWAGGAVIATGMLIIRLASPSSAPRTQAPVEGSLTGGT